MDAFSIFIYLSTFFISSLCFVLAQKLYYTNVRYKKILGVIFGVFSILIPCLLASFRGLKVGIDIYGYITPNFVTSSYTLSKGFFFFWNSMSVPTEIGFAYLMYVCCQLKSIGLLFFIIEFLAIFPVLIVLNMFRRQGAAFVGIMTFFFLFYNLTLCVMRVSIAMSALMLAYVLFPKHKKKALLLYIFAIAFHSSAALLGVIFYAIYRIVNSQRMYRNLSILFGSLMLFFVGIKFLLPYLVLVSSFLNPRYGYYLSEYIGSGSFSDIPVTDFLSKFVLIAFFYRLLKGTSVLQEHKDIVILVLVGRYFVLFNAVFYEAMRIAFYFDLFLIVLASLVYSSNLRRVNKLISYIMILLPSFFYWIYFMMYKGAYETNYYYFR